MSALLYYENNQQTIFNDSYSGSGLLEAMGLNWWVWFESFMDKEERTLLPEKAKEVAIELEKNKDKLKDKHPYYMDNLKYFIKFLKVAAKKGITIECSI